MLKGPSPMVFTVDTYSGFVGTYDLIFQYILPDAFICNGSFRFHFGQNIVNTTRAYRETEQIGKKLSQSIERYALSNAKISSQCLNIFSITYRCIDTSGE